MRLLHSPNECVSSSTPVMGRADERWHFQPWPLTPLLKRRASRGGEPTSVQPDPLTLSNSCLFTVSVLKAPQEQNRLSVKQLYSCQSPQQHCCQSGPSLGGASQPHTHSPPRVIAVNREKKPLTVTEMKEGHRSASELQGGRFYHQQPRDGETVCRCFAFLHSARKQQHKDASELGHVWVKLQWEASEELLEGRRRALKHEWKQKIRTWKFLHLRVVYQ